MDNLLTLAFFGWIGPPELIVIAIVAIILFGKKLPDVGRSLGKGLVEFKHGLSEMKDEIANASEVPEKKSEPEKLSEDVSADEKTDKPSE